MQLRIYLMKPGDDWVDHIARVLLKLRGYTAECTHAALSINSSWYQMTYDGFEAVDLDVAIEAYGDCIVDVYETEIDNFVYERVSAIIMYHSMTWLDNVVSFFTGRTSPTCVSFVKAIAEIENFDVRSPDELRGYCAREHSYTRLHPKDSNEPSDST